MAGCGLVVASCARGHRDPARITPGDAAKIGDAHSSAYEASKVKDPSRAAQRYEEALGRYSNFPAAWNNMGVALMEQGKFLEAEQAFARAAEQSQTDPRPLFNRGLLWMRRQYPADAREHFRRALLRDPYYLPALRGQIECDVQLRQGSDETLDNIRRALMLETDPKWIERLKAQRVKIQAGLNRRELPRSLEEMDLGLPAEPMEEPRAGDGPGGRPADDRERRMIEDALQKPPSR